MVITVSAIGIGLNSQNVKYRKNNQDKSVKETIDNLYSKADDCYGYHVGDEITVDGIDFYVIANSPATQDYVVALKKEPLTVAEVNTYGGVGSDNNHVNRYTPSSVGTAYNNRGYGGMAYYTSETCGYVNGSLVITGCNSDYMQSEIKYTVDAWTLANINNNKLKEVNNYKARLITSQEYESLSDTHSWKYNSGYWYWTMSNNGQFYVLYVFQNGELTYVGGEVRPNVTVRPVINVYKSAITKHN